MFTSYDRVNEYFTGFELSGACSVRHFGTDRQMDGQLSRPTTVRDSAYCRSGPRYITIGMQLGCDTKRDFAETWLR